MYLQNTAFQPPLQLDKAAQRHHTHMTPFPYPSIVSKYPFHPLNILTV
jgi:hypothetical protein